MRLLLDTNALLWWLTDDDRLGSQAQDLISNPCNDILVSVVSLWEMIVRVRAKKLKPTSKKSWMPSRNRDSFCSISAPDTS